MHEKHYDRLAETYERFWAGRSEYVSWMTDRIMSWLEPAPGCRVADIGAGTGLFLRRLMEITSEATPILCVDPSQMMLDGIPADPRLRPVLGTAEQVAAGEVPLPYDRLDAVVFKESIHHVVDIPGTLKNFAARLARDGRIVVVTLPPRLEYPLFGAALDRFAARQPDPAHIGDAMRGAGLEVSMSTEEFPVDIDRHHWLSLVADRAMSVLSSFSDAELEAGLEEIRERHTEPTLTFTDRFAVIRGTLGSPGE